MYMKKSDLKKCPSKRTRLTYMAYYQLIGAKLGRFLAIIRARNGPTLPQESSIRCTKHAIYHAVAWVAYCVLSDNKGVKL